MNFTPLTLYPLPSASMPQLENLVKGLPESLLGRALHQAGVNLTLRVRSIDELMALLAQGRYEALSLLEWLLLPGRKATWDERHPHLRMATAVSIWDAAVTQPQLLRSLTRHLLQAWYGKPRMAASLVEAYDLLDIQTRKKGGRGLAMVEALHPERFDLPTLMEASIQQNHSLGAWLLAFHLPDSEKVLSRIREGLIPAWLKRRDRSALQRWLILHLQDWSDEQQAAALEHLVETLAETFKEHAVLLDWVRRQFRLSEGHQIRWNLLNSATRRRLLDWIGAANYQLFQQLVSEVIDSSAIACEDSEINQLRKRRVFWKHYTQHFISIRILLPQATEQAVGFIERHPLAAADCAILSSKDQCPGDYTRPTEICIFEFETCMVVEFFRGPGSETLLFEKTPHIHRFLMSGNNLSVKRIRFEGHLQNAEVLDHAYCWQGASVAALEKRQVRPNPGIQMFLLDDHISYKLRYQVGRGLEPLTSGKQAERGRDLESWRRRYHRAQQEARLHYTLEGVSVRERRIPPPH